VDTPFSRLATAETYARGIERAETVVAIIDGAEWIQHLFDLQCPGAERILDFPHAAQRLSSIAQVLWAKASEQVAHWQTDQIHALKHSGVEGVLAVIEAECLQRPDKLPVTEDLAYLTKQVALMDYPRYQVNRWPIASSCVESANKLVVEARLKGAGMHWARSHVNPMVALRNVVCSERWQESWPVIVARRQRQARAAYRRRNKRTDQAVTKQAAPCRTVLPGGKAHKPPANHPWKRPTLAGGARHNIAQRNSARD